MSDARHDNPSELAVCQLGLVSYEKGLEIQRRLVAERRKGRVPDLLLFLEHSHVITMGVSARLNSENVLASSDELVQRSIKVVEAPRGGDVTYHGPGQLIGYPILDLRPDRCDVHKYVRDLEEVIIRALNALRITSVRIPGLSGVWIDNCKVAAIGVRLSRWITSHGFALNVETDLDYFKLIRPCGIRDKGVTSVSVVTGQSLHTKDLIPVLAKEFGAVFDRSVTYASDELIRTLRDG
tara:strand:- start:696 stop:1409 length:714 start_codon:yes stop_codon:yes gene_type:complete